MNKTKLIEDNMNLVYHIIHKYYPTYRNDEDLKQVGMVGLCKAADAWDGVSSKFSTFATKCIMNQIKNEFRNRSRIIPHLSLDNQICEDGENNGYDIVAIEDIDFTFNNQLELFIKQLTPREVEVVRCMNEGLNQIDIARKLNVSKQTINRATRGIRLKWRKFNGED